MPIELAPTANNRSADEPANRRRHAVELERRLRLLLEQAPELDDLPSWQAGPGGEHLAGLDSHLTALCNLMLERIRERAAALSADQCVRYCELMAELHALRREHADRLAGERLMALTGVADVLGCAGDDVDVRRLLQRAAQEAARICGLDRVMIFRLNDARLIPEVTYFVGHAEWAAEVLERARQNPIELSTMRYELEMIRRRTAALITEPRDDPRIWGPTLRELDTEGFVSVPVSAGGVVIATLHGDTYFSGRRLDLIDRDTLAAFATGLGHALERADLIERLHAQREAVRALARAAERTVDDLCDEDFALGRTRPVSAGTDAAGHPTRRPGPGRPGPLDAGLTPRESEIMALMAGGATNGEIARRLVVTEGTVKTHVKHVLRKLGAVNRAQAVSFYLRGRLPGSS
jgi:LuxR family transcriptional regulator, regulator of acetate metabolism